MKKNFKLIYLFLGLNDFSMKNNDGFNNYNKEYYELIEEDNEYNYYPIENNNCTNEKLKNKKIFAIIESNTVDKNFIQNYLEDEKEFMFFEFLFKHLEEDYLKYIFIKYIINDNKSMERKKNLIQTVFLVLNLEHLERFNLVSKHNNSNKINFIINNVINKNILGNYRKEIEEIYGIEYLKKLEDGNLEHREKLYISKGISIDEKKEIENKIKTDPINIIQDEKKVEKYKEQYCTDKDNFCKQEENCNNNEFKKNEKKETLKERIKELEIENKKFKDEQAINLKKIKYFSNKQKIDKKEIEDLSNKQKIDEKKIENLSNKQKIDEKKIEDLNNRIRAINSFNDYNCHISQNVIDYNQYYLLNMELQESNEKTKELETKLQESDEKTKELEKKLKEFTQLERKLKESERNFTKNQEILQKEKMELLKENQELKEENEKLKKNKKELSKCPTEKKETKKKK